VARSGATSGAKLTLHFNLADFMRIAAGKLDPAVPVLQGRATLEGDFGLATRLAQMFG
jgi:putative sterol carrier protein